VIDADRGLLGFAAELGRDRLTSSSSLCGRAPDCCAASVGPAGSVRPPALCPGRVPFRRVTITCRRDRGECGQVSDQRQADDCCRLDPRARHDRRRRAGAARGQDGGQITLGAAQQICSALPMRFPEILEDGQSQLYQELMVKYPLSVGRR
jgi:hypothetical protein